MSSGGAPTPAGTSVFTKHNWDMGMVLSFLKFESKLCESVCHIIRISKDRVKLSSNILQSRVSAWSDIDLAYNWEINVGQINL